MSPPLFPLSSPVCWVPGEYIASVSFFPWVCLIHYQKFLLIRRDCMMVPRAWSEPPPRSVLMVQRTSQPCPGAGAQGRFFLGIPSHFVLLSPSHLANQTWTCFPSRPDKGNRRFSQHFKARFRYPSCQKCQHLQVIGTCMTYQLIIQVLPGPTEEITAGLAFLRLNYQSRYSLVVYFDILNFCH